MSEWKQRTKENTSKNFSQCSVIGLRCKALKVIYVSICPNVQSEQCCTYDKWENSFPVPYSLCKSSFTRSLSLPFICQLVSLFKGVLLRRRKLCFHFFSTPFCCCHCSFSRFCPLFFSVICLHFFFRSVFDLFEWAICRVLSGVLAHGKLLSICHFHNGLL